MFLKGFASKVHEAFKKTFLMVEESFNDMLKESEHPLARACSR